MIREATVQSFYLYVETKDGIEIPFQNIEEGYATILNSIITMKPNDMMLSLTTSDTKSLGAYSMLLEIIAAYDSQSDKTKDFCNLPLILQM